ncbi:MAG: DNA helicase [Pseudomonadota bacterium]
MPLPAPIFVLKRTAKRKARDQAIPLHRALDLVAAAQGFCSWSHLAAMTPQDDPTREILPQLATGTLCLIAARPGHGKTRLGLNLALSAARLQRRGHVFTLEYTARDIVDLLRSMNVDPNMASETLVLDTSDDISARHIINRLGASSQPALVVVDYLQLLDQKRSHPSLEAQMAALQRRAAETGDIFVLLSQIDRAFDLSGKSMPGISDLRLPNPLDLAVFHKIFFLHEGRLHSEAAA